MKTFYSDQELYDILIDYGFIDETKKALPEKDTITPSEKFSKNYLKKGKMRVHFDRQKIVLVIDESLENSYRSDNPCKTEDLFSFLFYSRLDTNGRKEIKYLLKDKNMIFHIMAFSQKM